MSFSEDVKQELMHIQPRAKHCRSAEVSALRRFGREGAERLEKRITALKWKDREEAVFDETRDCCRRAYLRGTFLAAGSVSDPAKSYHLEFSVSTEEKAKELLNLLLAAGLTAGTVQRKNRYILYLKEGEELSDFLNLCGAHQALMAFENARILREMRNSLNRRVNCETANLEKTASASVKQLKEIKIIEDSIGLSSLAAPLKEAAELRLLNPELPMAELGKLFSPPLGKSGVNHRMQKISEIAGKLEPKH